jgi:hypothetical protein
VSIDSSDLRFPKGELRRQARGRKARAEVAVKRAVRMTCADREGYHCRLWTFAGPALRDGFNVPPYMAACSGPLEWAHLHSHRRSQTRGQAPTKRHTTAGSLMLCRYHHQEYDAHRLFITCLTRKGADGPLKFRRAK